MPIAYTRPKRQLTVAATALALAASALPAWAGPRAPIVYAADRGVAASAAPADLRPAGKPGDKVTQRIEFRYPGDPVPVVQGQPVRAAAPEVSQPGYSPGAFVIPEAARQGIEVVESAPLPALTPAPAPIPMFAAPAPKVLGEAAIAIVYGDEFQGLPTANGEVFDQNSLTAAHPTLPLPSLVQVTNPANGQQVELRVNDRGPFEDGATLQVSKRAASVLRLDGAGPAQLMVQVAGSAATASPVLQPPAHPAKPAQAELLGGDELAGGPKTFVRNDVAWPEPPTEWGVTPAVVKTSASAPGSLYVQLGSFSDIGNAEALFRSLGGDLPVEIVPARVNGADYFRVRVGPLADRSTAQSLRDVLSADGKGDGRIVSAD